MKRYEQIIVIIGTCAAVFVTGLTFRTYLQFADAQTAFRRGYDQAKEEDKREKQKIEDELKSYGFCDWPKAFYRQANCGSLAPDYPEERK